MDDNKKEKVAVSQGNNPKRMEEEMEEKQEEQGWEKEEINRKVKRKA